ncbi:MAG: rhomboid family intramembrane serine protease [Crocinitomicaceae bacterium]|nr:rhomboid family intramembrane serine protease [Crocinitomicaceae bacterium]
MENNRNFLSELKYELLKGKMNHRLLIINVAFFIFIQIWLAIGRLGGASDDIIYHIFTLDPNFTRLLYRPWGILTSIFSHFDFIHLLFNMVFLYFAGKIYEDIFDSKRLLITYIIGGIFGGLAEIIIQSLFFPLKESALVVGASGSIMAIFVAVAFHSPNMKVQLFGRFSIRLYFVALFFLIQDIIGIGKNDGIAHFAHLGGAIFGVLSVQNSSLLNRIETRFTSLFKGKFGTSKKQQPKSRFKSNEDYNQERREQQIQTDKILDKISKGGYESLTKQEKDFLFKQSKNGK